MLKTEDERVLLPMGRSRSLVSISAVGAADDAGDVGVAEGAAHLVGAGAVGVERHGGAFMAVGFVGAGVDIR